MLEFDAVDARADSFDIEIADDTISDVRPSGERAPRGEAVDAQNCLVTPGLINGHHHSHEHFHKGRYDNLPLELWMNYMRPPEPLPLTPRDVYLRTMVGAVEALRSGTTTLIDDLNVSPVLRPDHVEAAFRAYEDIGIRSLVGISLFDKPFYRAMPFVEEEFPPGLQARLASGPSTPPEEVLAFARELAAARHPRDNRVGYIVAPSAPQRCSDEFLMKTRALADEFGLPAMIHVHETRLQAVTAQEFYGKTMIAHLSDLGFLKNDTSLIHAVWLTPGDIGLLADSGTSVQHNPTSNLKLGSGVAPVRALLDAGVNVSLGTDGCGSTETLNMLRTVNMAALVNKLRGGDRKRWVGAREAWRAGTVGGAAAIGLGDRLGRVAAGYRADLAVYNLSSIPFAPLNNPLHQLVFAADSAALKHVYVGGEPVLYDGKLTKVDEAALIAEIGDRHRSLVPLIAESEAKVDEIRAAYERICARCEALEIPEETLPAKIR
ncbi:amidohydrolase family protein [Pelagibius sp. CAU 1746]|uniref:amidohydrolase family protein n=1 Tax=Pelagibius sp. CAU 1746 TaxID=3140370 RepID=UPI00325BE6DE